MRSSRPCTTTRPATRGTSSSTTEQRSSRGLLLDDDQLAVVYVNVADKVRQFELIPLLRKLLLQRVVHQPHRNVQVADLELGRREGDVSVLAAKMSSHADVNV